MNEHTEYHNTIVTPSCFIGKFLVKDMNLNKFNGNKKQTSLGSYKDRFIYVKLNLLGHIKRLYYSHFATHHFPLVLRHPPRGGERDVVITSHRHHVEVVHVHHFSHPT